MKGILVGSMVGLIIGAFFFIINLIKDSDTKDEKTLKKESALQKEMFKTKTQTLKDLKKKGILTEQEYGEKVNILIEDNISKSLNNSIEYKQLKSLYEDGILTKEEFENKIQSLKNILLNHKNDKQGQEPLISQRLLIGTWEYKYGILEFGLSGDFTYKQANGQNHEGSWLLKNNKYIITTNQKDFNILSFQNKKLKIRIDDVIYECIKVKPKSIGFFQTDKGKIKVELNFNGAVPAINNRVFQNNVLAKSGKYKLGYMNYIIIKDGIIMDLTIR